MWCVVCVVQRAEEKEVDRVENKYEKEEEEEENLIIKTTKKKKKIFQLTCKVSTERFVHSLVKRRSLLAFQLGHTQATLRRCRKQLNLRILACLH